MNTSKAKKSAPKADKKEVKEFIEVTSCSIDNVRVVEGKNGDIVFFTMILNGVTIYNCRVATGKNGDFVSWPQIKGKDDKYYNQVYAPLSDDAQKAILDLIQEKLDEM